MNTMAKEPVSDLPRFEPTINIVPHIPYLSKLSRATISKRGILHGSGTYPRACIYFPTRLAMKTTSKRPYKGLPD
jgi:hypothetical protein